MKLKRQTLIILVIMIVAALGAYTIYTGQSEPRERKNPKVRTLSTLIIPLYQPDTPQT